ncbi:FHF complex subunit HOOK interacting protein 2B isoform X1 [Ictalurus punctatus]|uniref:FHF complex subunit HOOK interacting protein 2B isoform X1 n=1 Tax=Ictalurus punctatus TaxID=7998 RepID=W5UCK2_ICTPU|nr:FHF complex subunit HOOK interacting protein 2B isoform X1 [Ictalurus punctatus]
MDMFNKLTTLFQQALETREPSENLLDSFVDHWKGITNYYIETTDEAQPVKQTDIPWRLKQMLDILVYEEREQDVEETGPCMEYLLQHKLLETLCTLGKAQYPPGMSQQVLLFFSKLLAQIQKPMLHVINVYRPVQKLIRLCGLPDSQTEKEESLFLFTICSRVKKDPYVLNYILETDKEGQPQRCSSVSGEGVEGAGGGSSPEDSASPSTQSSNQPDTGFIRILVQLGKSQKSRVALRAMESVLILTSVPHVDTSKLLAEETPLCDLLAERACELYGAIPVTLHPEDIHSYTIKQWRIRLSPVSAEETQTFPAQEHVDKFFCWLDYCDQLIKDAPEVLAVKLARALHQQWLTGIVQPQLLQMSEVGVLVHTALLSRCVHHIRSAVLLHELVHFLLGGDTHREQQTATPPHSHVLRYHLIKHCDHISDEISVATLRLFEELLKKPDKLILTNLVLRNLETRSYRMPGSGGVDERSGADLEFLEESEEMEEDPFFTDSEFSGSERLLSMSREDRKSSARPQIAETVNSFLCLVPQEAKTSQHAQGAGYDTYVHDALTSLKECSAVSADWGWPDAPKPIGVHSDSADFYEGHFLKVLLDRIARILEQPYELNLQVTSVLSRLAAFPHPHLHEYLLDPYVSLSPGTRSLFSTLVRVIGELMQRIQHIPDFTQRLVTVRKQLTGLEEETVVDHGILLKGVIVLEEFCKELAAIAFVKLPMGDQEHLSAP